MPTRQKIMLALLLIGVVWGGHTIYKNVSWKIVNNPPPQGPIVAFGDSLTAGVGANRGLDYPRVLSQMIGQPVVNKGVAGNLIADAGARLEKDVIALKPSIVIVLLGGNDVLTQQPMDQSFKELERIVKRIQERGAMVVLVGLRVIAPIGGVGARYRALARDTGCVFVDDILDDIYGRPALMSDQIHPNAKGYRIVAERIAKKLKPYLQNKS